jgi:hypothetical protein
MRILLANEPRSHREVFAGALRALRPHLEVITVKPDALEGEAPRLRPDAVVCSRITPALRNNHGPLDGGPPRERNAPGAHQRHGPFPRPRPWP